MAHSEKQKQASGRNWTLFQVRSALGNLKQQQVRESIPPEDEEDVRVAVEALERISLRHRDPEAAALKKWVDDTAAEVQSVVREFGEKTFWDVGPFEIVNLGPMTQYLRGLSGAEAGRHLEALAARDLGKRDIMTETAEALLGDMYDRESGWWEECDASCPSLVYRGDP